MTQILTCTRCSATTAAGIHLCSECTLNLEGILEQIPDTVLDAADTIAREDKVTRPAAAVHAEGSASPANLTAIEQAHHLATVLADWREEIYHVHDCRECPPMADHVNYYQAHTGVIRRQPWSAGFFRDLEDNHRELINVVDLPPDRLLLGRCTTTLDEGARCTGVIRAVQSDPVGTCRDCGTPYDVANLQERAISRAWRTRAPLAVVVEALRSMGMKVSLKSAQRWARTGALQALDTGPRGALYTPAQVQAVAVAKRTRQTGVRHAALTSVDA